MSQVDLFAFDPPTEKGEVWIDVSGHEGEYAVSNHGRVLSYPGPSKKGGLLDTSSAYQTVSMNGESATVHHLVIKHHGPPQPSDQHTVVNHIDADPTNNHVDNLEWATPSENLCHGGLMKMLDNQTPGQVARRIKSWAPKLAGKLKEKGKGEAGRPKALDERDVHEAAQMRKQGKSLREIATYLNVSRPTVHRRLNEYQKEHDFDLSSPADRSDARRKVFN